MSRKERRKYLQSSNEDESVAYTFPESSEVISQNQKASKILNHMTVEQYSGPIPPPTFIEGYERVVPGFGKQLLEQFLAQSDHRMVLEKLVIQGNRANEERGQWFSFIIFMTVTICSFVAIYKGKSIEGVSGIIIALGSALLIFFSGKNKARTELESKKNPKFPQKH